ncbi:hypothetical protein FQN60_016898 [Etheostoma spectabile]|uniref:Uncharacterized protein n=1 Tax=Etheostoma spectabile TaxID=54343 RepID=A0A5J5DDZ6_9PERO|nr:hypothetical protein FQN60_016898 [Etheostoma spectabile]
MTSSTQYIQYHGIRLPLLAHSKESLEYAEKFSVKDTDVFSVTYPKSETHSFESLKFAHEFTFKDEDVMAVVYPKSGPSCSCQADLRFSGP